MDKNKMVKVGSIAASLTLVGGASIGGTYAVTSKLSDKKETPKRIETTNAYIGNFSNKEIEEEFLNIKELVIEEEFKDESGITSIAMPTVKEVRDSAFLNANLNEVILSQVKKIGKDAFGKSEINSLIMPSITDANQIGDNAFASIKNDATTKVVTDTHFLDADKDRIFGQGNWDKVIFEVVDTDLLEKVNRSYSGSFSSLTQKIKFFRNLESFGDSLFENEKNLKSISVPGNLHIGKSTFKNAPLESIVLPDTQTIGENAFQNVKTRMLDLPNVKTIEARGFGEASELSSLKANNLEIIGHHAFLRSNISELKIPKAKEIGEYAFWNSDLESGVINLPNVTKIGVKAFYRCKSKSIQLPMITDTANIGDNAFALLLNDPSTVVAIGTNLTPSERKRIFSDTAHDKITVIENVKNSFEGQFEGSRSIPAGEKRKEFLGASDEIKDKQFTTETLLTKMKLSRVITIGVSAFDNAKLLTDLSIPRAEEVKNFAFWSSPITHLDAPNLRIAGDRAFGSAKIKELELNNLEKVGIGAFSSAQLVSIVIPKVTDIGNKAFESSRPKFLNIVGIKDWTKVYTSSFKGIVNDPSTTVEISIDMPDAEKDRIFGAGHWDKINFVKKASLTSDATALY